MTVFKYLRYTAYIASVLGLLDFIFLCFRVGSEFFVTLFTSRLYSFSPIFVFLIAYFLVRYFVNKNYLLGTVGDKKSLLFVEIVIFCFGIAIIGLELVAATGMIHGFLTPNPCQNLPPGRSLCE